MLDRFLNNLGTAVAPAAIFGANPNAPAGGATTADAGMAAVGDPGHLMEEITDAPQLFQYDDIAHSGHMLVKVIDRVVQQPKQGKKPSKKKKEEWTLEYFILLQTKHIVHFEPTTGFVDPFTKKISGKAIDLMQAQVSLSDEDEPVDIPKDLLEGFAVESLSDGFEVMTARHQYILRPKESSAEAWVEQITEVMFDNPDDDNPPPDDEVRDYNDFLVGYNETVPDDEPEPVGA